MVKNYGTKNNPKFSTEKEDKAFEKYRERIQKEYDEMMERSKRRRDEKEIFGRMK
jgi:hypothetical protein